MWLPEHERFMRQALELAKQGWGATHPNPMVGALVVESGTVVAQGHHEKSGGPHAERAALAALGRPPLPGAILYVTLEPCSTQGRTGACTDLILQSGVKQVVVGATDPNPAHAGKGFELLKAAGIEVIPGVLERECRDLNLIYNHWIQNQKPLMAGKLAVTLDGRIACRTGDSRWITGEEARVDVHHWRRLFPAIAVGAGTVMKDNPRLTARPEGKPEWCPVRFVFDGLLRSVDDRNLPRVYTDEYHQSTIVVTTARGGLGYVRKLKELGIEVWVFDSPNERVPLSEFRKRCAAESIYGVYFEGGADLMSRVLFEREIDYLYIYHGPILLADGRSKPVLTGLRTEKLADAVRLTDLRHEVFGDDILSRGRVAYPNRLQYDENLFSLR